MDVRWVSSNCQDAVANGSCGYHVGHTKSAGVEAQTPYPLLVSYTTVLNLLYRQLVLDEMPITEYKPSVSLEPRITITQDTGPARMVTVAKRVF